MLRELKEKDAEKMLEWMHNPTVVKWLGTNFLSKKKEDCLSFIRNSCKEIDNIHFAVTNAEDVYLGTVSLKNVNRDLKIAEFAIVMHECAIGKGIAHKAMSEILEYGYRKQGLETIYWCVNKNNLRAINFYNKQGYKVIEKVPAEISAAYEESQLKSFLWYSASNNEEI